MLEKCLYNCETCGSTKEIETAKHETPECCGKPMKKAEPLEHCRMSNTAEHARLDAAEEPCDEGRGNRS